MSVLSFNCNEAPEPENFDPLPKGTEAVSEISESEYTDPNDKGTRMLRLKFKVLDGPYKGRVISEGYCLECPTSAKAEEIAQRKLRQICEALNMTGFTMTEELHGKPMLVKYGQEKPNDQGDVYNNVKSCKPYGAATPPVQAVAPAPAQTQTTTEEAPAQATTNAAPPWATK